MGWFRTLPHGACFDWWVILTRRSRTCPAALEVFGRHAVRSPVLIFYGYSIITGRCSIGHHAVNRSRLLSLPAATPDPAH